MPVVRKDLSVLLFKADVEKQEHESWERLVDVIVIRQNQTSIYIIVLGSRDRLYLIIGLIFFSVGEVTWQVTFYNMLLFVSKLQLQLHFESNLLLFR